MPVGVSRGDAVMWECGEGRKIGGLVLVGDWDYDGKYFGKDGLFAHRWPEAAQ